MVLLCLENCTANPVIKGQKVRASFMRGCVYEEGEIGSGPWQRYFRELTPEEADRYEAAKSESPPKYLKTQKPEPEKGIIDTFRFPFP